MEHTGSSPVTVVILASYHIVKQILHELPYKRTYHWKLAINR
ncbi:hypothetical protein [Enterococcus phage MDA2]|uniref:Uncharacterized protein n=1 Tax=Enterococcus phage MDA2 TaxID=2816459 RepID=A0AAE7UUY9_9CAUD|nr:hypothetical protein [Enterococcus phage MDA2]